MNKFLLYAVAVTYVVSVSLISLIEPFLSFPCHINDMDDAGKNGRTTSAYPNPDYIDDPCRLVRFGLILYFTREECMFARRLVASVILGGVIGWERRQADRPAGIRTMALVSLASCLFTLGSAFAFRSGPQNWDASRISAAIPSGVGFLGAGLIFKEQPGAAQGGLPIVHGLTTSASLWMSSAVGIACGGGMYHAASFTTGILMVLLRFGPRVSSFAYDEEDEEEQVRMTAMSVGRAGENKGFSQNSLYGGIADSVGRDLETQSIISRQSTRRRQHPQLV